MADRVCWSCDTYTHMTIVKSSGRQVETEHSGHFAMYLKQAAFSCDHCKRLSIGFTVDSQQRSIGPDLENSLDGEDPTITLHWLPERSTSKSFPDVPDHIAGAATEATLCLSIGAYRAVGALARAVIEATAKERDAAGKNLEKRIDALCDQGGLHQILRDQAHEVRHFGNDMAHGDFAEPVTKEEAEEILALMEAVLKGVYQDPAQLTRRKEAREASKGAKND